MEACLFQGGVRFVGEVVGDLVCDHHRQLVFVRQLLQLARNLRAMP